MSSRFWYACARVRLVSAHCRHVDRVYAGSSTAEAAGHLYGMNSLLLRTCIVKVLLVCSSTPTV